MKIFIYDIETLKEYFLFKYYDPEKKEYGSFKVNQWENTLVSFARFIEIHKDYYFVGFNNLRFDAQVCQWILNNYENWEELSNLDICHKIWQKAQDVIDNSNFELQPEFREYHLSFKQIDLFLIWHFNNENRRTSLKALEYAMDMENIEEMPINHDQTELTKEDIQLIDDYCTNDLQATYQFYLITLGQTDLKLYKGENRIEDRLSMKEEFGLDCLNWDDVKIGAEWNKLDYKNATGKKDKDLRATKIKHFYGKKFKEFFPTWVTFQTPELQKFAKEMGNTYTINKKQEFKFDFSKIVKK